MALSNWDTLAVTLDGKASPGNFHTEFGHGLEIYKNWINVSDSSAWNQDAGFPQDIVLHMEHGYIRYKTLSIHAIRGPKQGIYVAAIHSRYNKKTKTNTYEGFVGIGCYGYDNDDFVGVQQPELDYLKSYLEDLKIDNYIDNIPDLSIGKRFNQGDAYLAGGQVDAVHTEPGKAEDTILSSMFK